MRGGDRMKRVWIKPHTIKRGNHSIHVKGHYVHVTTSTEQGRSGNNFKSLEKRVEREYRKKGYSKAKAEQIGKATAGKIFWKKYGKKSGSRILKRER